MKNIIVLIVGAITITNIVFFFWWSNIPGLKGNPLIQYEHTTYALALCSFITLLIARFFFNIRRSGIWKLSNILLMVLNGIIIISPVLFFAWAIFFVTA